MSFRVYTNQLLAAATIATAILFQGSASHSLAPSAVRTVSVAKTSQLPKKGDVYFATSGQSAAVVASAAVGGAVGGLIAAGISAAATADERAELHERIVRHRIDPGLLAANE